MNDENQRERGRGDGGESEETVLVVEAGRSAKRETW